MFLMETFCNEEGQPILKHWSATQLFKASWELSRKILYLSPKLSEALKFHPLYPPRPETVAGVLLVFDRDYVKEVAKYHKIVRRPEGTFAYDKPSVAELLSPQKNVGLIGIKNPHMKEDGEVRCDRNSCLSTACSLNAEDSAAISALIAMPREVCPKCTGRRQLYCGDCCGLRMPIADILLPPRIDIPFEVLLLVHWAEALHRCTGVHCAALCQEGLVRCVPWTRPSDSAVLGETWGSIVASLDPDRDLLLFPSDGAIDVKAVPWMDTEDGRQEKDGLKHEFSCANHLAAGEGSNLDFLDKLSISSSSSSASSSSSSSSKPVRPKLVS